MERFGHLVEGKELAPLRNALSHQFGVDVRKNYPKNQRLFHELRYNLLVIVLGTALKKAGISNPLIKRAYDFYYGVICKYSYQKLQKLMSHEEFFLLFRHYVVTGGFEEQIKVDRTMSLNPELYKEQGINMLALH